jgi:hypothetical protein
MTCEEYLAQQERQALQSLTQATRLTGTAVEQAVDLQGHVRRRPALSLGLSAAAGFVAASVICTNSRRLTRGALQSVWSPLLRPTLGALGSMVAKALLGSAAPSQE